MWRNRTIATLRGHWFRDVKIWFMQEEWDLEAAWDGTKQPMRRVKRLTAVTPLPCKFGVRKRSSCVPPAIAQIAELSKMSLVEQEYL